MGLGFEVVGLEERLLNFKDQVLSSWNIKGWFVFLCMFWKCLTLKFKAEMHAHCKQRKYSNTSVLYFDALGSYPDPHWTWPKLNLTTVGTWEILPSEYSVERSPGELELWISALKNNLTRWRVYRCSWYYSCNFSKVWKFSKWKKTEG